MIESGFFFCGGCFQVKRNDLKSSSRSTRKRTVCTTCVTRIENRKASRDFGKAHAPAPYVDSKLLYVATHFDHTLSV